MQPVYPSTETLTNRVSNRVINKLMQQLFLWKLKRCLLKPRRYLMQELQLIPKKAALFNIHFPKAQKLWRKPIRLKFEELFFIQLQFTKNLVQKHKIKGHPFSIVGDNFNDFYKTICL
jgi:ATP-dependent DNA helicase RecG